MKVEELRLGNWILNSKREPEQVWILDKEGINNEDSNIFIYDDYDPIPLTPEILEACGFALRSQGHYNYHSKVINEFCNSRSELSLLGDTAYFNGAEVPHPEYLHQLQNLYFALTNTELEVKVCDANPLNQGTES